MPHSSERILTTHVGSLPRSEAVTDMVFAEEKGERMAPAARHALLADAVDAVVASQCEAGVDVVSDGEMSKISYATYIKDRITGFENIGNGEGFMFAALGGDDPGRVTWAPYVFDGARKYGLVLLESGRLIDTQAGETIPADQPVMPATTPEQVAQLKRLDSNALESCVARHRGANGAADSVMALNASGGRVSEEAIIGQSNPEEGMPQAPLAREHGFHLRRLEFGPGACLPAHSGLEEEVWTIHGGNLRIGWGREALRLGPGDVLTVPIGLNRTIENPTADPAEAFVVRGGDSPGAPHWT